MENEIHELKLPDQVPDQTGLSRTCMAVYGVCSAIIRFFRGHQAPPVGSLRFIIEDNDYKDLIAKIYDSSDQLITQFQMIHPNGGSWTLRNYVKELDALSRMCNYLEVSRIKNSEIKQFLSLASDLYDTKQTFDMHGYKDYKF